MPERHTVRLAKEERDELLRTVARGKNSATTIRRANILLAVDRGDYADLRMSDEQAAAAYHACRQTVSDARKRFAEGGIEAVLPRKQRSRPGNVKLDGDAGAKVLALYHSEPPEGHESWTLRLLAQKAVEQGYVESISHVAIGDFLKRSAATSEPSDADASKDL